MDAPEKKIEPMEVVRAGNKPVLRARWRAGESRPAWAVGLSSAHMGLAGMGVLYGAGWIMQTGLGHSGLFCAVAMASATSVAAGLGEWSRSRKGLGHMGMAAKAFAVDAEGNALALAAAGSWLVQATVGTVQKALAVAGGRPALRLPVEVEGESMDYMREEQTGEGAVGPKGLTKLRQDIKTRRSSLVEQQRSMATQKPDQFTPVGAWRAARELLERNDPVGAARVWSASPFNPAWDARYLGVGQMEREAPFARALSEALEFYAHGVLECPSEPTLASSVDDLAWAKSVASKATAWFVELEGKSPQAKDHLDGADGSALGMSKEGLFGKVHPLVIPEWQLAVPAGAFALVSDKDGLALAQAAADMCREAAEGRDGVGVADLAQGSRFGGLVRRWASALMLDGPARASDWAKAIAMSAARLAQLGDGAPGPGCIPIELHAARRWTPLGAHKDRVAAARGWDAIKRRVGKIECKIDKIEPESAAAISKMHVIAGAHGPSYMSGTYGPGTERVYIGLRNGGGIEALADLVGGLLSGDAGLGGEPKVLGKAQILLHESFHLQQDWAAAKAVQHGGAHGDAIVPEGVVMSGEAHGAFERAFGVKTQEHGRWLSELAQEGYADVMAAFAMGGFEAGAALRVCRATSKWRATEGRLGKKLRGSAETADGHMTFRCLELSMQALAKLPEGGMPRGASLMELGKTLSLAGALRTVADCLREPKNYTSAVDAAAIEAAQVLGCIGPKTLGENEQRSSSVDLQGTMDWREQAAARCEERSTRLVRLADALLKGDATSVALAKADWVKDVSMQEQEKSPDPAASPEPVHTGGQQWRRL